MNYIQRRYNWWRNLRTPPWLKRLLGIAQTVLEQIFALIKEDGKDFLKDQIYQQSKLDIDGTEKLKNVANAFKEKYLNISMPRSWLNLAIEFLLAELKLNGVVD